MMDDLRSITERINRGVFRLCEACGGSGRLEYDHAYDYTCEACKGVGLARCPSCKKWMRSDGHQC